MSLSRTLRRSLTSLALATLVCLPSTALAADSTGSTGTLDSVEVYSASADTYLQYNGRILVSGGGRTTEYRWGGSSCSNKSLPDHMVALLSDALARRDVVQITPRFQAGQGTNKCLVGFTITPVEPPAA